MSQFFENVFKSITEFITNLGTKADVLLVGIIKIVAIIVAARIIIAITRRISRRMLRGRAKRKPLSEFYKKAETIQSVSDSAIKYAVYFLAFMAILGVLGLGTAVGSMLAAAGIGGIVIALGAQSLVKDIVSGIFTLFENQYAVGEYIEIDGEKGTVSAITLRTTSITKFSGETATIPNGNITKIINYSRGDHLAIVDMPVSFETDIEKASTIMQSVGLHYKENNDNVLEEPHVLGIIEFGESEIVLRMIMRVKPLTHWATERALRQAIKEAFDAQGVSIPFPHRVVING